MLKFFGKSEKKGEIRIIEKIRKSSELEQICGDKDVYESLMHTMFLDPRKIEVPVKEAAENAKRFEKEKNPIRARMWYDIAGGLAIYEGNAKGVVEFFSESQRISGRDYLILKTAEKSVAAAQEFYKKYLKD